MNHIMYNGNKYYSSLRLSNLTDFKIMVSGSYWKINSNLKRDF